MTKVKHIRDSERYSIMTTNLEECFICNMHPVELHEVFNGIANRQKSKDYGLVVPLCVRHHREAHENGALMKYLRQEGQRAFEFRYSREKFMDVFKKNYLEEFEI